MTTNYNDSFQVGPRKQSIPKMAEQWGCRWFYLRMFSVNAHKNNIDVVTVYRSIINQRCDDNGNWIESFMYSDDYETFKKEKWTCGNYGDKLIFENLTKAYEYSKIRIGKLQSIWPIIEDEIGINLIEV